MLDHYVAKGVDLVDEELAIIRRFTCFDILEVLLQLPKLRNKGVMLVSVGPHRAFA